MLFDSIPQSLEGLRSANTTTSFLPEPFPDCFHGLRVHGFKYKVQNFCQVEAVVEDLSASGSVFFYNAPGLVGLEVSVPKLVKYDIVQYAVVTYTIT